MIGIISKVLIVAVVVVVFIGYMATYTVRFTETALVTTWGEVGDGSVKNEAGLKWKIPFVQSVVKYDTRLRYLESNLETQSTNDDKLLVTSAYVTWRVSDPLRFYQKFGAESPRERDHYDAAEDVVQDRLRSVIGEQVSKFAFAELIGSSEGGSRIPELERMIRTELTAGQGPDGDDPNTLSAYGITVQNIGITKLTLPQETTRAVIDRMKKLRDVMANKSIDQGEAEAVAIRKQAEADSEKILSFARERAARIRAKGDAEAATFIAQLAENEQLATFIIQTEFLKQTTGRDVTLVLNAATPGFGIFQGPQAALNPMPWSRDAFAEFRDVVPGQPVPDEREQDEDPEERVRVSRTNDGGGQ